MRCIAKKTLQVALESGNDVLLQLKANQPALLRAMVAQSEQSRPRDRHHHDQIGQRNRIESRTTLVWPLAADSVDPLWSGLRCLIQVKRHTELFNTSSASWRSRSETAWYVCSRDLSAQAAAHATRNHWLIENALHHVRDVAMGEDACRIRRHPGAFAQLRSWALNLLRLAGHDNITAARQSLAWAPDGILDLIDLS